MEEEIGTCPLGSKCKEIKEHEGEMKVHRCMWHIRLEGRDPQTGKEFDERGCAIQWMPLLFVELSRTNEGISASVQSFRNEMVDGNNAFMGLINQAKQLNDNSD